MKLKEYFNQRREITVSAGDKLGIYQNIISKRNSKSFYPQRKFFFVKSFAYSLVMLFLVLGLYGTYIFNGKFIINKDGFFIQRSNGIKSVQADYIAKIIEFNGNFYIGHNGEYYQGSYISNGDIVTLQNGAEIIFHIDQLTQAKVVGPAKFLITKNDDNYKLNLVYGDFIELKSIETDKPQNIEFSTQNLTIKQSDKTKAINFQLIKQGEQTLLKNNGPQLIITQKTQDNKQTLKELNSDKILSIQDNDISIINDEKLSQAITQKNFTQTLSFNTETNTGDLDVILNKEYLQEEKSNEGIINNIGLPNDKLIPTEQQMSKLLSNLSQKTLSKDIQNITSYYSQGDNSIDTSIISLESKIKQIYISFNIDYTKIAGSTTQEKISQLNNNIDKLSSILQEKYHIPPTYINNLNDVKTQLSNIVK
ncbi:MAG: hypothetical protein WAZ12_02090 [Candidatus Absconditicoccaceae bacterium]